MLRQMLLEFLLLCIHFNTEVKQELIVQNLFCLGYCSIEIIYFQNMNSFPVHHKNF